MSSISEMPRPRLIAQGLTIQKLYLPSYYETRVYSSTKLTYSFGSTKVAGIILKTEAHFALNFWTRSMFFFKKSFLDTFLDCWKWFILCQASSLLWSILDFDHDHSRFQEWRKSTPWGNSFHLFFLWKAIVMISYTSALFLITLKYKVGCRLGTIKTWFSNACWVPNFESGESLSY